MEGALIARDESANDSESNEAEWNRLLTFMLKIENIHYTINTTKVKGDTNKDLCAAMFRDWNYLNIIWPKSGSRGTPTNDQAQDN